MNLMTDAEKKKNKEALDKADKIESTITIFIVIGTIIGLISILIYNIHLN